MEFEYSEEREELRSVVRQFLEAKSPSSEVRRLMETDGGYDPAVWRQMARELGLHGIHIAEEYGGQGFSFIELAIVVEEMGRALLCAPFFATVCLAANAISNIATNEQRATLLPPIAAGDCIATLAVTEPSGQWGPDGVTMVAGCDGTDWVLNGTKTFVIDGHIADLIIVVARTAGTTGEQGLSFFAVSGTASGLTRTLLPTMDLTRKQSRLDFDGVRGQLLGSADSGWPALQQTLQQAVVCLANEMVGGSQKALEMAVDYAKVRVQFGRPIGSFQAIKHKCADMLVAVEMAKSVAYWAAIDATDTEDLALNASLAKAFCSDAYLDIAAQNIQVHGGIGFTWEHDAQLYFKRAKTSQLLFGDAVYHREQIAEAVGI